jgi:hypothetical protein
MGNSVTRGQSQLLEAIPAAASGAVSQRHLVVDPRAASEPHLRLDPAREGSDRHLTGKATLSIPCERVSATSSEDDCVSITAHSPCSGALKPVPAAVVQPLSPGRYKVQFTASAALRDKLERLQALMRSQIPDADLGAVIEAAVSQTLERLEARRFAATKRPRKSLSNTDTSPVSRYIPAAVRRAVHERDASRCRYVDAAGRRCEERHHLQYHHIHTFALGGDHGPANVRLLCKRHNDYVAECDYGRKKMARFRRAGAEQANARQGGAAGERGRRAMGGTAALVCRRNTVLPAGVEPPAG